MPGKIKPGTKNNTPFMTMDIFLTMLDIADIEYDDSGKPLDGESFFPVVAG